MDISSSTTVVSAKKNINSDHINLNTDLARGASADNCEKIAVHVYSVKAIKIGQTSSSKADINVKQQDQKPLKSTRKLNTQRKRMPKIKDMEKVDIGELDKVFEKI